MQEMRVHKKGDDLFINSKNVLAYGAQSSFYQYLRKSTNNRTIAETSALNNRLLVASTFIVCSQCYALCIGHTSTGLFCPFYSWYLGSGLWAKLVEQVEMLALFIWIITAS